MKILSVIVPCYNSEAYMEHAIRTLLESGGSIEIVLVNDGSKDRTGAIADQYAFDHPERIRAVHQENAGHGGAVNAGIKAATGKYIKVVDSDDWVDPDVLRSVVDRLSYFVEHNIALDLFINNFIYDKVDVERKKIMSFEGILPMDRIFTWEDTKRFTTGKYLLMHNVIFCRDVIDEAQLELPEHTFYVDNLYVYLPLQYVKTMYYMNACLYHYFIGREDQSVNEKNMLNRLNQQLAVNQKMIEGVDLNQIDNKKQRRYMIHYLNIVTTVSSVFLLKKGTKEAIETKKRLWKSIKKIDPAIHYKMKRSLLGTFMHIPGKAGRKVTMHAYNFARSKVGFN